jgi:G3E family GTPase
MVEIILITGFLGSGKTTFINWLLTNNPNQKISVILNEFGSINLESQFINKDNRNNIVEIANGCMCCVAKNDIPRVINFILNNSPETKYILIEASGLSDPDPVKDSLKDITLKSKVVLKEILCIVDAINFEKSLHKNQIVMSQIGDADKIIISKIAKTTKENIENVQSIIKNQNLDNQILIWDDKLSAQMFFDPNNSNSNTSKNIQSTDPQSLHNAHQHEHYDEIWFESEKEFDLDQFRVTMNSLPDNILRIKGIIKLYGNKILVQYVQGSLELQYTDEVTNTSHLLIIGNNLNENQLKTTFEECLIN